MPTFSQSLEQSLHRALAIANERHHQYATLEHLLLSLIDDSDAAAVMRACSVDLDKLRTSLVNYLETEFENLVTDGADDAKLVHRIRSDAGEIRQRAEAIEDIGRQHRQIQHAEGVRRKLAERLFRHGQKLKIQTAWSDCRPA